MTILAMLMFGAVFFALLAIAVSLMADEEEETTWVDDTVELATELGGAFWDWVTGADDPEEEESASYEDLPAYEDQSMQEPYEGSEEAESVNGQLDPDQEDPADDDLTAYEDQSMQEAYEDEDYGESESAY